MTDTAATAPLIIAGGGLAGSLLALALAARRPEVPLLLVEGSDRIGGNHIWSFFDSDVASADRWIVDALVSARWNGHAVRFPGHSRVLSGGYQSIRSEQLDSVVRERVGPDRLRFGARIAAVEPDALVLEGGERLPGRTVIDARGVGDLSALELGWQKFVGIDYRFDRPHGINRPLIMDATVDQLDGYRFVYLLPFSDTELLVEDTYYANDPDLDVPLIRDRIAAYMAAHGLHGAPVREETGVLPVTIAGDPQRFLPDDGVPRIGMAGGFFHPTTGYSLPDAVRIAALIVRTGDLSAATLAPLLRNEALRLWRERSFYRLLNKMLFRAAEPSKRVRVLEHFYRLPEPLIGRFYAGRSTFADKARILSGKPPVPVGRAIKALLK